MKKFIAAIALVVLGLINTGCMTTVEPGYTGIKINKVGTNRGVSKENLVSGWVFYFPVTTKVIEYPTFMQRVVWTEAATEGSPQNEELVFNTKDQIRVDMDASINYTLEPTKVPEFYTQFRADDIRMFTHGYLRDVSRNAVTRVGGEYNFEDLNGLKKEEFLSRVEKEINAEVGKYGVVVKQFSSIGNLRPPDQVNNAVIAKAKSTQEAITAENQLRQIKAEAAKAVAQAEGEAAAMRAKAAANSPQYLELKRLEIQEHYVKKWDGKMPVTMLGGGTNTLFQLK